jgi:hypothetical protein
MAGYSGTPLPKKLGIKSGYRVALVDVPKEVQSELNSAFRGCVIVKDGPIDFAMISVTSRAALESGFARLTRRLSPAGMIWVSWPKKTSGVKADLDENAVRQLGLDAGLVDVKVCAVNETWSGLKFVIRLKDRKK